MTTSALILFAHGARDPNWSKPMQSLQQRIQARDKQLNVSLAFLEFMSPDLPSCVSHLVAEGVTQITILPIFIATGGHLKNDLPALVDTLRLTYPAVSFTLAGAVGEAETVLLAMADHALELCHAQ